MRSSGSSPLTRGTRGLPIRHCLGRRFIPAYAGNSSRRHTFKRRNSVHPRLRGELVGLPYADLALVGSSPLTRGTQWISALRHRTERFIPAYAGNSIKFSRPTVVPAVHPRLRGELWQLNDVNEYDDGSSPLTRGTRNNSS